MTDRKLQVGGKTSKKKRKKGVKDAVSNAANAAGAAVDATSSAAQRVVGDSLGLVANVGMGITDVLGGLFGGLRNAAERFESEEEIEDEEE